jgi:adenine/guanine phosphoribosyltransferase-like PRPP-binding protein
VNPRNSAGAGEIGLIAKIAARDDDAAQRIYRKHRRFDQGWDKLREETFARQKALGAGLAIGEITEPFQHNIGISAGRWDVVIAGSVIGAIIGITVAVLAVQTLVRMRQADRPAAASTT